MTRDAKVDQRCEMSEQEMNWCDNPDGCRLFLHHGGPCKSLSQESEMTSGHDKPAAPERCRDLTKDEATAYGQILGEKFKPDAPEESGLCSAHQHGEDPSCRTCYPAALERCECGAYENRSEHRPGCPMAKPAAPEEAVLTREERLDVIARLALSVQAGHKNHDDVLALIKDGNALRERCVVSDGLLVVARGQRDLASSRLAVAVKALEYLDAECRRVSLDPSMEAAERRAWMSCAQIARAAIEEVKR